MGRLFTYNKIYLKRLGHDTFNIQPINKYLNSVTLLSTIMERQRTDQKKKKKHKQKDFT